jgi:hypothetical protein
MKCSPLPRGNSAADVEFAPNYADGVKQGEPVGILVSLERGLVYQAADGESQS